MHFVYWFRKDLRLKDNRALSEFIKETGENSFSFIYIKNNNSYSYFGEKRVRFLNECLEDLGNELSRHSLHLQIFKGKSTQVFKEITEKYKFISLYFNRQIEPYCIKRDNEAEELLKESGGRCLSFKDSTLFEHGEILNNEGNHFKVFTPFKNKSLQTLSDEHLREHKSDFSGLSKSKEIILDVNSKSFPESVNSDDKVFLKGGRTNAVKQFKRFYETELVCYKSKRDYPGINGTSLLSAHIHFGTLSIRELFRAAFRKLSECRNSDVKEEVQTWINELLWREFYYDITFHCPRIMGESFKKEFDNLKWNYDENDFGKWCSGHTGYPIVDAGMRQLNTVGWMHNRVRMITAMFLTKDLFMDWRLGEKYFAEKLIDFDFSSNNGGWQWSASTGVDSQPYFRIFNPYLQSRKFDPEGNYIRKYVPELNSLPNELIHEPDLMSKQQQKEYKVVLGKDYPFPIVDHKAAKEKVIKNFKNISEMYMQL